MYFIGYRSLAYYGNNLNLYKYIFGKSLYGYTRACGLTGECLAVNFVVYRIYKYGSRHRQLPV